jgi:site-specific recombinase XerD
VAKTSKSNSKSGNSNPIRETIQTVAGQPSILKIYKIPCSRYWQARVYVKGKYRISSLQTEDLKKAQAAAKRFFIKALLDAETAPTGRGKQTKAESRSFITIGKAFIETQNLPDKQRRYNDDRIRFNKELAPYFANRDIGEISTADIMELTKKLQLSGKTPATTTQYLVVLRKILKYAANNRLITSAPNFPRVTGKNTQTNRDYFPQDEYELLVKTAETMADEQVKVRGVTVTLEFKHLIQFMVNSFLRPSDLRVLKHQHVEVKTNEAETNPRFKKFLLLKHPATKTTDQHVVTMPAAFHVYQNTLAQQTKDGYGAPSDFVFFPQYPNRNTMMQVAGRLFKAVLKRAGLERDNEHHTLYSLRHTSIMYRLLLGTASTLEIARNARTSEAMIDKHYASRLTPMMAVESLHSFKSKPAPAKAKKPKSTTKA